MDTQFLMFPIDMAYNKGAYRFSQLFDQHARLGPTIQSATLLALTISRISSYDLHHNDSHSVEVAHNGTTYDVIYSGGRRFVLYPIGASGYVAVEHETGYIAMDLYADLDATYRRDRNIRLAPRTVLQIADHGGTALVHDDMFNVTITPVGGLVRLMCNHVNAVFTDLDFGNAQVDLSWRDPVEAEDDDEEDE